MPPQELKVGQMPRGAQRSGVDPPLCSSRACLHTAFTAIPVHHSTAYLMVLRLCLYLPRWSDGLALVHPPVLRRFAVVPGT